MSYSTMASTLNTLRAQNFKEIQAEQLATKLLEEHKLPQKLFDTIKQQCLENPKLKLDAKKLEALQQQMSKNCPQPAVDAVLDPVKLRERLSENPGKLSALAADLYAIYLPKCWSSIGMERLMNWRNPAVDEKPTVVRSIVNLTKKLVTEVALPFLTVTAAVEAVATKALVLGAKLIKRPTENLEGLNRSAGFTTLWTISTLWHNIVNRSLPVYESEARNILFKGHFKL